MAWAAGFVDAACWLIIDSVYTSHMTGNTAAYARSVAQGSWSQATLYGWVIVPFMLGLVYSAAMIKAARRADIHSSFAVALGTEIVALVAFIGLVVRTRPQGVGIEYFALSLPAAAMGIQTVTVTKINGLRVYTTYVTGSLSKCAEAVVDFGFWLRDRTRGRSWKRVKLTLRLAPRNKRLQHVLLTGGLWAGFFGGAVCGVLTQGRFGPYCLLAPVGVLVVAVGVDLFRPVAAADDPGAHRHEPF